MCAVWAICLFVFPEYAALKSAGLSCGNVANAEIAPLFGSICNESTHNDGCA